MKSTLSAKRKGDALITIRQNNNKHLVEICNMNNSAEKLTGYHLDEVLGLGFDSILPDRINESLHDYIEFEDPENDFASVARKIPNFQILSKKGNEIAVSLKIFYLASENQGMQEFELLLRDIRLIKKIDELKTKISDETDGRDVTDVNGLMDAYDTAYEFVNEYPIEVTFATFGIDSFSNYMVQHNDITISDILNKFAKLIKQTCRNEDVVAYVDKGVIGVILLDCNTENARDVISRILDKASSHKLKMIDGSNFNTTLSISYAQINPEYSPAEIFNACVDSTFNLQDDGGNAITELS